MFQIIASIILSPILIVLILAGSFLVLSRWVLLVHKEYAGYALGVLLGFFFMVIYSALGGDSNAGSTTTDTLTLWQVIWPTFLGLFFGALVLGGALLARRFPRTIALQMAFYTAFNLVLLLMMLILGPIGQQMIGIFSLSLGITALFAMVAAGGTSRLHLTSTADDQTPNDKGTRPTPGAQAQTRLDDIRRNQELQNRQRR